MLTKEQIEHLATEIAKNEGQQVLVVMTDEDARDTEFLAAFEAMGYRIIFHRNEALH
jgi:hypothetical protein